LLTLISIIIAGVLLLQAETSEKTSHKIFKLLIGKDEKEITNRSKLTIRSVVHGILGIAIIQSVAAGILMLAFRIPGAGLWALIVLFLVIVQLPPTIITSGEYLRIQHNGYNSRCHILNSSDFCQRIRYVFKTAAARTRS